MAHIPATPRRRSIPESAPPTAEDTAAERGTRARRDEGRQSCPHRVRTTPTTKVRAYPHAAFQLTSCINPNNVQQHIIGNTLHIGNLSRTVTEKELSARFVEFGKINNVFIVKDPFTQYAPSHPFAASPAASASSRSRTSVTHSTRSRCWTTRITADGI